MTRSDTLQLLHIHMKIKQQGLVKELKLIGSTDEMFCLTCIVYQNQHHTNAGQHSFDFL